MNKEEMERLLQALPDQAARRALDRRSLDEALGGLLNAVVEGSLSGDVFTSRVLEALGRGPSKEVRDALQYSLMAVSIHVEDDRLVHYWRGVMLTEDKWQRERAIGELFRLARSHQAASDALRAFLKQEPTKGVVYDEMLSRTGDAWRREDSENRLAEEKRRQVRSELRRELEALRQRLPGDEFISLLLQRLDKGPPSEIRDILEVHLGTYSYLDEERVVLYWKTFLSSGDAWLRERAIIELFILANRNSLARSILEQHLGAEPTFEDLKERLRRLFDEAAGGGTQPA